MEEILQDLFLLLYTQKNTQDMIRGNNLHRVCEKMCRNFTSQILSFFIFVYDWKDITKIDDEVKETSLNAHNINLDLDL